MILTAIQQKPEVTAITVIEASLDVINLVAPTFQDDPRIQIIHADAFSYKPPKGQLYDVVWHDIWDDICADNLTEMTQLHRKYGRRTKMQSSWAWAECELLRRRSKRYAY